MKTICRSDCANTQCQYGKHVTQQKNTKVVFGFGEETRYKLAILEDLSKRCADYKPPMEATPC